jgi:hypothetical protein
LQNRSADNREVDVPNIIWYPDIGGIRLTVASRWSPWTDEGQLVLNRNIIKTWGTGLAGPIYTDINFEIEGHTALPRNNRIGFDLYVVGEKVPHSLAASCLQGEWVSLKMCAKLQIRDTLISDNSQVNCEA